MSTHDESSERRSRRTLPRYELIPPSLIVQWRKSSLIRPAATLAIGTLLGQAITIATVPIVTRLFDPSAYGALAVFAGWVSVSSVVATGRYDYAVLLGDDRAGWTCTVLIGGIAAVTALFVLVGTAFASAIGLIAPQVGILAAVSVFATAGTTGLTYWLTRRRSFGAIAQNRVVSSLAAATMSVAAGNAGLGGLGLVASSVSAQVLAMILLLRASGCGSTAIPKLGDVWHLAKKHADYPRFLVPSGVLDRWSSQAHVVLLVFLQGAQVAGLLGIYERLVSVPQRLLSNSVGDVFKQKASEELVRVGHCRQLYRQTAIRLAVVGLAPFSLLLLAGPAVFATVFGPAWRAGGELAQIMALKFYAGFVVSPLSSLLYIGKGQRYDLYIQVGLACAVAVLLPLGSVLLGLKGAVAVYAFAYCCKYGVEFHISSRIAHGLLPAEGTREDEP